MLIIFTGIPGSGKTSLAVELKKNLEKRRGVSVQVVDSDEIRRKTYQTNFDPDLESFIRNESLYKINELLKQGHHVISDDINYYQSMRHELKEIARKNHTIYLIVFFDVPLETCLKRNKDRGYPIPQDVIEKIQEKFDKPGQKYKWDSSFYRVTGENSVKDEAVLLAEKIEPYLNQQLKLKSIREEAELSMAMEIDKITRKLVSTYIKEGERNPKKVSDLRKEFLKLAAEKSYALKKIKDKFYKFLEENLE